jgi:hypothetical protein
MAESADAMDSKSIVRKDVRVRPPLQVPLNEDPSMDGHATWKPLDINFMFMTCNAPL